VREVLGGLNSMAKPSRDNVDYVGLYSPPMKTQ